MEFRYRYVDFGTVFRPRDGARAESAADDDPAALFANELALDVGGICWGSDGERLSVIDHHLQSAERLPSASAAVMRLGGRIQEKFHSGRASPIWLVTHRQPDFDAFCSMYLARTLIATADAGWRLPDGPIDWFAPPVAEAPPDARWMLLLSAYASHLDSGRHLACPRHRALHSVLYAALYRGRPYLTATSGATQFFDEVARAIREDDRNPLFDSVLENSVRFRPELQILDREVEAYRRDLARARIATVHLPCWRNGFEASFAEFRRTPLLADDGTIRPVHLDHAARVQADAVYLRDPECLLFKEWARTDTEAPPMRNGFLFTAVAYSGGRPHAISNRSDYFFAIDPERAAGHHLYTVWARLEAAELAAIHGSPELRERLEKADLSSRNTSRRTTCRIGFEDRAGADRAFFDDPWFDGSNFECTIVATPNRGTLIGAAGSRDDLLDDRVVEIVRRELEHSVFLADPGTGTVTMHLRDLPARSASGRARVPDPHMVALEASPPPIADGHFRFGRIQLHPDVDLFAGRLAQQVGTTLWHMLDPAGDEGVPDDVLRGHLIVSEGSVAAWGRRGIALACKPDRARYAEATEQQFVDLVKLARDVVAFADRDGNPHAVGVDEAERLTREVAHARYRLALPENQPLARFFEATGLGELLHTVRDLNIAVAGRSRNQALDDQSRRLGEHTETIAHVQTNLEWLEIIIISVYSTELARLFTESYPIFAGYDLAFVFAIAIGVAGLTAFVLKPWRMSRDRRPIVILVVIALMLSAGIAANLWFKPGGQQDSKAAAVEHRR
jgi:hypothetical protein